MGSFVDRFEAQLAAYTGVKHAIAVVNGTAALHIALRLAGVQAGDEVLLPAMTFVATSNAVSYCGAMPHFVDSEERTLGFDPRAARVSGQRGEMRRPLRQPPQRTHHSRRRADARLRSPGRPRSAPGRRARTSAW